LDFIKLILIFVKVKEMIEIIETDGWYLDRIKGSYRQFKHSFKKGNVTIAGKLSTEMPKGTIISILKQAKLK
jgi:predicted RNA binding protein YcfA (HicA-like mRNA interferase family)